MTDRRVVITLSPGTLDGLGQALTRLGVASVTAPLLSFSDAGGMERLRDALRAHARYTCVAITSRRAASAYARAAAETRVSGLPVWATGHGTARELRRSVPIHVVETPSADGAAAELARMMLDAGMRGRVLYPCGVRHRPVLTDTLRSAGLEVDEVVCYAAEVADEVRLRDAAAQGEVLIVGSGAVAEALARVVPAAGRPSLVALGPATAGAAARAGWQPAAVADEPTVASLLQTLHGVLKLFPAEVRTS